VTCILTSGNARGYSDALRKQRLETPQARRFFALMYVPRASDRGHLGVEFGRDLLEPVADAVAFSSEISKPMALGTPLRNVVHGSTRLSTSWWPILKSTAGKNSFALFCVCTRSSACLCEIGSSVLVIACNHSGWVCLAAGVRTPTTWTTHLHSRPFGFHARPASSKDIG
jgi:hypothetical protein